MQLPLKISCIVIASTDNVEVFNFIDLSLATLPLLLLRLCCKINVLGERGLVFKETVVLRRWGSDTRKFGLSTELIM